MVNWKEIKWGKIEWSENEWHGKDWVGIDWNGRASTYIHRWKCNGIVQSEQNGSELTEAKLEILNKLRLTQQNLESL